MCWWQTSQQPVFRLHSPPPFGRAAFSGLSKYSFFFPRLCKRSCNSPSGSRSDTDALFLRILPIKGQTGNPAWHFVLHLLTSFRLDFLLLFFGKKNLSIIVGLPVIPGMYQQPSSFEISGRKSSQGIDFKIAN